MSKTERVEHLRVTGRDGLDPHYAGWFACFNRGDYYEAHDVLEALWLRERGRPNDAFYKGLIQLAGAFVHLQKNRLRPADALFRLAESNLARYPSPHERLELGAVIGLIRDWRDALAAGDFGVNPLANRPAPRIEPLPATRPPTPGAAAVEIRRMTEADIPGVAEVFRRSIEGLASRDYAREEIAVWVEGGAERLQQPGRLWNDGREALVAERGGSLAGFLTFEADGHLDLLYTAPDHARRGVATALLAAAEAAYRERGVDRLYTGASRTARPFFERHGWVVVASQKVPIGDRRLVNFRMEKRLAV